MQDSSQIIQISSIDLNNIMNQIPQISPQIALNSISLNQAASCGYCKGLKSDFRLWVTSGFQCKLMGSQEYQMLLDRGWRRSGAYYYRPSVAKSCCQAFTIRCDSSQFKPRKFQTKVIRKINKIQLIDQLPKTESEIINQLEFSEKKSKNPNHSQKDEHKRNLHKNFKGLITSFINKSQDLYYDLQIDDYEEKIKALIQTTLVATLDQFSVYESGSIRFGCNYWAIFYSNLQKQLKRDLGIEILPLDKNRSIRENINKMLKQCENKSYEIDIKGQIFMETKEKHLFFKKAQIIQVPQKLRYKSNIVERESFKNKITTKWVKAEFDQESFNLYCKYQRQVHQKDMISKESYISFLCQQSLQAFEIHSSQQTLQCGCWHVKYYLEGKLISVGVVDVLACSMSSVYFFYDPAYRRYSLGVYGVLCEIEFMKNMQQNGHPQFRHYYLGFYIQDIGKMNYKADYYPSEILCPATFQWIQLDENLRQKITLTSSKHLVRPYLQSVANKQDEQTQQISDEDYYDVIKQTSGNDLPNQQMILEDMNIQNVDECYLGEKVRLLKGKSEFRIPQLKPSYKSYFTNLFKKFLPLIGATLLERFLFVYN